MSFFHYSLMDSLSGMFHSCSMPCMCNGEPSECVLSNHNISVLLFMLTAIDEISSLHW